jgi:hypothetical protein
MSIPILQTFPTKLDPNTIESMLAMSHADSVHDITNPERNPYFKLILEIVYGRQINLRGSPYGRQADIKMSF